MIRSIRRGAVAAAVSVVFVTLAASPALSQVEALYTGVRPPVVGNVLGTSGGTTPAGAVAALQGQVLPLQVSSGGVGAVQQARVEGLAFTGADIVTMVAIAFCAMAVGVVLTRRARPNAVSSD